MIDKLLSRVVILFRYWVRAELGHDLTFILIFLDRRLGVELDALGLLIDMRTLKTSF